MKEVLKKKALGTMTNIAELFLYGVVGTVASLTGPGPREQLSDWLISDAAHHGTSRRGARGPLMLFPELEKRAVLRAIDNGLGEYYLNQVRQQEL